MDYLDPEKKKRKKTRLMIMYALFGVLIGVATLLLVYIANGYFVDRKTGEFIQNGLLYIDAKPAQAQISLNGQRQERGTDARLVIPEGVYQIDLFREGYRPWSRNLVLEGGSLRRITYPRLIPETLQTEVLASLPATPNMVSQSINRRWLVLAYPENPLQMNIVDLASDIPILEPLTLGADTLLATDVGVWEVVEWADDNQTFLAKYTTPTTTDYVLIDRENPNLALNVRGVFPGQPFTEARLRDRKKDRLFLYDGATKTLTTASVSDVQVDPPFLTNVEAYTTFGTETVLYATKLPNQVGEVRIVFRDGDKSYNIRDIKEDTSYLLELARLGNAYVLGVGSKAENRVLVYNDPIDAIGKLTQSTTGMPVATTVLRIAQPEELVISADSSIILARSGKEFASHEFEAEKTYRFTFSSEIDVDSKVRWLDGQHAVLSSGGKQVIFDFDGSNQYGMTASIAALSSYFSEDYDKQSTFLPADPATNAPARIDQTYLRIESDR